MQAMIPIITNWIAMCAIANVASVISIFSSPWNFTPSINLAHTFCRFIFAYTILYTKMPIAHFVEHFGKRKRATQGEREICFSPCCPCPIIHPLLGYNLWLMVYYPRNPLLNSLKALIVLDVPSEAVQLA